MNKRGVLLLSVLLAAVQLLSAQAQSSVQAGMDLYRAGKWKEAVLSLRRAITPELSQPDTSEALYWVSLSEMAMNEYGAALEDLDALIRVAPQGVHTVDALYQKGRALYHVGRYDSGIVVLKSYSDLVTEDSRKAAAAYWIGECLFALGRLDDARSIFTLITDRYAASPKYEAASYRIALIDQKGIENELLKLLKWSHEESLKTVEEYQRRERSYEQAIVAYQKRIADMLKDTRLADLDAENKRLSEQAKDLEKKLNAELEKPQEAVRAVTLSSPEKTIKETPLTDTQRKERLEALRIQAISIQDALNSRLEKQKDSEEVAP